MADDYARYALSQRAALEETFPEVLAAARQQLGESVLRAGRVEATRQRLLSTGMLPERVDALMAAWEAEAGRRGLPEGRRYADEIGWEWMVAQRGR
jgi:hypothetical protein